MARKSSAHDFASFMRGVQGSEIIEKSDAKCDFETHDASKIHDIMLDGVKILDTILDENRRWQIDSCGCGSTNSW